MSLVVENDFGWRSYITNPTSPTSVKSLFLASSSRTRMPEDDMYISDEHKYVVRKLALVGSKFYFITFFVPIIWSHEKNPKEAMENGQLDVREELLVSKLVRAPSMKEDGLQTVDDTSFGREVINCIWPKRIDDFNNRMGTVYDTTVRPIIDGQLERCRMSYFLWDIAGQSMSLLYMCYPSCRES